MKEEGFQIPSSDESVREYDLPLVSVIIPTQNAAPLIALTLETILNQDYPQLEIIIIDASSQDRTLETIKGFRDDRIRIFSVSRYFRYEMLNKGISHAHGEYLNFLFPGDYFIYGRTLRDMMTIALKEKSPSLVFCGSLLRDGKSEVKILFRPLTLPLLKNGQQPTSLQSCWFKQDLFKEIGKFNTSLELRGGYDLLCRFMGKNSHSFAFTSRVMTDYNLRWVTRQYILRHFRETLKVIYRYFGFLAMIKWLFKQKDFARYTRLWFHSVRVAFFGRTP
jgi:glycosyltransferase involved in cell wall biosynthesis